MSRPDTETKNKLINAALLASEYAYTPFSDYCVGAALLTASGEVYTGCNIENSSYGATNCAERTAIFKAVSEGEREFEAIAVVGHKRGEKPTEYAYPCGICRQVMAEFCKNDFVIIVAVSQDDNKEYTLSELLPEAFGSACIK